jgi:hypothetical protein
MQRLTAFVVLSLGVVVLVGGFVGLVDAVRERAGMPLPARFVVLGIVAVAMFRAAAKLREAQQDV